MYLKLAVNGDWKIITRHYSLTRYLPDYMKHVYAQTHNARKKYWAGLVGKKYHSNAATAAAF